MASRRSTNSFPRASDVVSSALRSALVGEAILAVVASALCLADLRIGAGALLGVVVVASFFAIGVLCIRAVLRRTTTFALVGALAVFVIQVYLLGMVGSALAGQSWWDVRGISVGALLATLVWQVIMVRAYLVTRQPVYDVRSEGVAG